MSRPQRLDRTSFRLTVAAALVGLLPIAPQFPLWLLVLLVALGVMLPMWDLSSVARGAR